MSFYWYMLTPTEQVKLVSGWLDKALKTLSYGMTPEEAKAAFLAGTNPAKGN